MTVLVWWMLGIALTVAFGYFDTRHDVTVVEGIGGPCPDCGADPGVPCHPACSSSWD